MISRANGVTISVLQHNNPDTVVVERARHVAMGCGQGNRFDNVLIQGDQAPRNNSWEPQEGYGSAKLSYTFRFSDISNKWEANTDGSVIRQMVHYNLFL